MGAWIFISLSDWSVDDEDSEVSGVTVCEDNVFFSFTGFPLSLAVDAQFGSSQCFQYRNVT